MTREISLFQYINQFLDLISAVKSHFKILYIVLRQVINIRHIEIP